MNRFQDPTVADRSGAFDVTTTAPEPAAQSGTVRASTRSTVLPRVEWSGDAATVVSSSRPRFQTQGGLGEGGMGEVVAALDHDIGREVAIKRLRPEVQGTSGMMRFLDEIRTVGSLEHPNIVPIHDVGVDENGALYFVMRRVQGETLESILREDQRGRPDRGSTLHVRTPRPHLPPAARGRRVRPRPRDRAPRHQASERHGRALRRGLPDGLGHRQARRSGRPRAARRRRAAAHARHHNAHGSDRRDAGVHVAGAGEGREGRLPL